MSTFKTKIARGGFSILFAASLPSRAVVHYFVVGTGGRQASGTSVVESGTETFVAVDFPVLSVGVTDLELQEAAPAGPPQRSSHPAIANAIISSILVAGGLTSWYANAAVRDHSLRWRSADVAIGPSASALPSERLPFTASG